MSTRDVEAVVAIAGEAFGVAADEEGVWRRWRPRVEHLLLSDPGGSFLAERDGHVIGVAQALRRARLWCLSLLVVRPAAQGAGVGRRLLQATLGYAQPGDAGLVVSSSDPRALGVYQRSGFSLRPTVQFSGRLSRSALRPTLRSVEAAGPDDLEDLATISRYVRGAPHTAELAFALSQGAMLVRLAERGFAVAMPGHGVWLLAALDEEAATMLLWSALEHVGETERPALRWITSEQDWAIAVALQAGLESKAYGALCVRGRPGPLRPYIPSGPFA